MRWPPRETTAACAARGSASPGSPSRRWDIAEPPDADAAARPGRRRHRVRCGAPPRPMDEIANAREATRIAELGYARLVEIARPGMSEDALALELKWYTKTLGAEDNFLLLCAGPRNRGGGAVERPHAAARRHPGGRDHAELSRAARADLPHRHARPGERRPQAQIRFAGARHERGHWRRPSRRSDGRRLPRHQYGAGSGGLRRILPSAAYPPARPRPRLRLDPAGRCQPRQRYRARPRAWCS